MTVQLLYTAEQHGIITFTFFTSDFHCCFCHLFIFPEDNNDLFSFSWLSKHLSLTYPLVKKKNLLFSNLLGIWSKPAAWINLFKLLKSSSLQVMLPRPDLTDIQLGVYIPSFFRGLYLPISYIGMLASWISCIYVLDLFFIFIFWFSPLFCRTLNSITSIIFWKINLGDYIFHKMNLSYLYI